MSDITLRLSLLVGLVALAQGYKNYQENIPNGDGVIHPCKSNLVWQGVGHQFMLGGGARNPFGEAFQAAKHNWTEALCKEDSDGDGKTNGEELGDPDCAWKKGDTPKSISGITHPGICEPTNSTACKSKNSWEIDCSEGADFQCDGIDDPDTVEHTVKFDKTKVPVKETTYMCQAFPLPSDKVYHLFASKPNIDNAYVMHHTIVYGCPDGVDNFETPTECGMYNAKCQTMLGAWTVGLAGECQTKDSGFLVGKGHFTTILIEQHWNNPLGVASYYDESGMTFYLTSKLRKYNMAYFVTGQEELEIPPKKSEYTVTGSCPGSCLQRKMNESVYITNAHVHMHYLGAAGKIEHYRNGKLINTLFDVSSYSYELPVFTEFDPPIELKPTDEIKTICTYQSLSQTSVTKFGQATSDEMCYGFMNYYPAEYGTDSCTSYGEYDQCEVEDYYDYEEGESGGNAALIFPSLHILAVCYYTFIENII